MPYRISKDEFEAIVQAAIEELPEQFRSALDEVPIEVADRPGPRHVRSLKIGRGHLLLGLYVGVPLTRRSVEDSGRLPDVIYLFQESIEAVCRSAAELEEQIRKTLLHEIGHYYGLDEDDLTRLGYG